VTWRQRIESLCPTATFSSPATAHELTATENAVGISLPRDLRGLLLETNGCLGEYGLGLIWTMDRIRADNLAFRSNRDFRELYMSFDSLLFFADAGNGDQFAFPVQSGEVRRQEVFVWNHENDSRTWAAPSLDLYLQWWLTGRLKL
jgi:hypothetical protein